MENRFRKQCDEAKSGSAAVVMYNKSMSKTCCNIRYRLILTDICMPWVDGFNVAKQVKKIEQQMRINNPNLPQVQIAFVTSHKVKYTQARA